MAIPNFGNSTRLDYEIFKKKVLLARPSALLIHMEEHDVIVGKERILNASNKRSQC